MKLTNEPIDNLKPQETLFIMKLRELSPSKRKQAEQFVLSLTQDNSDAYNLNQTLLDGFKEISNIEKGNKSSVSAQSFLDSL